jgi:hypothetical protein
MNNRSSSSTTTTTTTTSIGGLFNVHGIINLDQITVLFQQLIDHANVQNQKIADLEGRLKGYVPISHYEEKISQLEAAIRALEKKNHQLTLATTATINEKRYVLYACKFSLSH